MVFLDQTLKLLQRLLRRFRSIGVSYVGVSTALEVIMARALDMNVCWFSCSKPSAGAHGTTHKSVQEASEKYAMILERLVRGVLGLL